MLLSVIPESSERGVSILHSSLTSGCGTCILIGTGCSWCSCSLFCYCMPFLHSVLAFRRCRRPPLHLALHWLCCFFIVFLYFLTSIILTYLTITLEMVFSKRNRIYRVLKNYLQILFCFKMWHDMTGWGRQLVDSSLQWDLACDYIQPEWQH